MKNLKKKLAGFLIFAMVLGIMAPSAVTVVQAGSDPIEIDLVDEEATVLSYGNYDEVAYAEYNKGPVVASGNSIDVTIKDWEKAEGTDIDLSWLSKKKDTTLVFRLTKGKEVTYWAQPVKAQVSTLKVGFASNVSNAAIKSGKTSVEVPVNNLVGSEETGYLYFYTTAADKTVTVATPTSIYWKKGTSGTYTQIMGSEDFAMQIAKFKAKGATLYFQIPGETDQWPSNEAKYSYKKQANAPAVKLDVTKHTITLKAGQEYKVVGADGGQDKWVSVDEFHGVKDSKGKVKVSAIQVEELLAKPATDSAIKNQIYEKELTVKVRTAANGSKGTIPSKTKTVKIEIVSGGATDIKIGVATSDAIQVSYTVPYKTDKGVTLTNTTDTAYEFAYVASGSTVTATTKWTKLAAVKSGKNGTAKITKNYDENGSIFIRLPGDKTAVKLAGQATKFMMSNVKAVKQSVKSVMLKTVSGVTITNTTPDAITLTVASGTAANADVTINVDYEFTGLVLDKATAPKIVTGSKWPTTVKATVPKIGTDNKGTFTIVVNKGAAKGDTTVTYEIQNVKFSIKLVIE